MELRQLRYLVAVADELSFTRAAQRANVAQPALSRQLKKLEQELGVPLVDRTTRRVSLTDQGADLVERARRILAEVEAARDAARGATRLVSGRVRIGTTQTSGPIDVPRIMAEFRDRYRGIELALSEDLSVRLTDRLRRDDLDVAFVSAVAKSARHGLQLELVARDELCVVVGQHHAFAARRRVGVATLANEDFVAFPTGATIRETFEQHAGEAGFTPRVAFESNDVARTRSLVAQGLAIAVLPLSDARAGDQALHVLRLEGRRLTYELFVAWRRERALPPAARAFLDHVLEAGPPDGPELPVVPPVRRVR